MHGVLTRSLAYYFSDENLAKDSFLVSQMNADLYVPIALIAGFRQIQTRTNDVQLVVQLLRTCENVEVDREGAMARPANHVFFSQPRGTLMMDLHRDSTKDAVETLLGEGANATSIMSDQKGRWFISFESEVAGQEMLHLLQSKDVNASLKITGPLRSGPVVMQVGQAPALPFAPAPSFMPQYGFFDPQQQQQQQVPPYGYYGGQPTIVPFGMYNFPAGYQYGGAGAPGGGGGPTGMVGQQVQPGMFANRPQGYGQPSATVQGGTTARSTVRVVEGGGRGGGGGGGRGGGGPSRGGHAGIPTRQASVPRHDSNSSGSGSNVDRKQQSKVKPGVGHARKSSNGSSDASNGGGAAPANAKKRQQQQQQQQHQHQQHQPLQSQSQHRQQHQPQQQPQPQQQQQQQQPATSTIAKAQKKKRKPLVKTAEPIAVQPGARPQSNSTPKPPSIMDFPALPGVDGSGKLEGGGGGSGTDQTPASVVWGKSHTITSPARGAKHQTTSGDGASGGDKGVVPPSPTLVAVLAPVVAMPASAAPSTAVAATAAALALVAKPASNRPVQQASKPPRLGTANKQPPSPTTTNNDSPAVSVKEVVAPAVDPTTQTVLVPGPRLGKGPSVAAGATPVAVRPATSAWGAKKPTAAAIVAGRTPSTSTSPPAPPPATTVDLAAPSGSTQKPTAPTTATKPDTHTLRQPVTRDLTQTVVAAPAPALAPAVAVAPALAATAPQANAQAVPAKKSAPAAWGANNGSSGGGGGKLSFAAMLSKRQTDAAAAAAAAEGKQ
jgi:hypothetical protein